MRQVAALPFRPARHGPGGEVEVLLVTSFRARRWIIPKGNIDEGMKPHDAAAKEAEEEGGVRGKIGRTAIGRYRYGKFLYTTGICQVDVDVFPLRVTEELADWPEMDFRDRQWLTIREAAEMVGEAELAAIIRDFVPPVSE